MPVLSDGELAKLRTDLAALLPDLCNVSRIVLGSDDLGGSAVESTTQVETALPILVAVRSSRATRGVGTEQVSGDKIELVSTYNITLPFSADLEVGDIVTVTSLGNLQLRILQVQDPQSWNVVKQCAAENVLP